MPPKRGKTGPPYTEIPDDVYVVVTRPWGANPIPNERRETDFNRVAAWAQLVLQQAGLGGGRLASIDCIYSMGTRDEIIIQFSAGTDIIPLLGEHRWANICRVWTGRPDDPRATCVFIYNWRNNGDPSKHGWTLRFPEPIREEIPAKSPYPAPSWITPPPTLTSFVHPIPRPQSPPLNPPQNPPVVVSCEKEPNSLKTSPPPQPNDRPNPPDHPIEEAPAAAPAGPPEQDSAQSANLFRPYEPPSQYPSRIPPTNQPPTSPKEPSTPPLKFVKKLDPYELDDDAFKALRSTGPGENAEEATHEDVKSNLPLFIKPEDCDGSVHVSEATSSSRPIPVPAGDYQPSTELAAEMNLFFQGMGAKTTPSVTMQRGGEDMTEAKRKDMEPILSLSVKREPAEVKLEDFDNDVRHGIISQASPSSRPVPLPTGDYKPSVELAAEMNIFFQGMSAQQPPSVKIKRELDEDTARFSTERKKIKIEDY